MQSGCVNIIWSLWHRQLLSRGRSFRKHPNAYPPSPSHFLVQNHPWHVLAIYQIWPGNVYIKTAPYPWKNSPPTCKQEGQSVGIAPSPSHSTKEGVATVYRLQNYPLQTSPLIDEDFVRLPSILEIENMYFLLCLFWTLSHVPCVEFSHMLINYFLPPISDTN